MATYGKAPISEHENLTFKIIVVSGLGVMAAPMQNVGRCVIGSYLAKTGLSQSLRLISAMAYLKPVMLIPEIMWCNKHSIIFFI